MANFLNTLVNLLTNPLNSEESSCPEADFSDSMNLEEYNQLDSYGPEETNVFFQSLNNTTREHLNNLQLTHYSDVEDYFRFLHETMSDFAARSRMN